MSREISATTSPEVHPGENGDTRNNTSAAKTVPRCHDRSEEDFFGLQNIDPDDPLSLDCGGIDPRLVEKWRTSAFPCELPEDQEAVEPTPHKNPGTCASSSTAPSGAGVKYAVAHANTAVIPEERPDLWDPVKHRWKARKSSASVESCWKCHMPGHLPQDCTVKCNQLDQCETAKCAQCCSRDDLFSCLACDIFLCDTQSHLVTHLQQFPSHFMLYSFKLKSQIKCCNNMCTEMNIYNLLICTKCVESEIEKSTRRVSRQTKRLKTIRNCIACELHFSWHIMNCGVAADNPLVDRQSLDTTLFDFL
ncbi:zinc finger protein [Pelomyxa schiedti]|nr:zinc finger protein [Pelomyxa schiedti]